MQQAFGSVILIHKITLCNIKTAVYISAHAGSTGRSYSPPRGWRDTLRMTPPVCRNGVRRLAGHHNLGYSTSESVITRHIERTGMRTGGAFTSQVSCCSTLVQSSVAEHTSLSGMLPSLASENLYRILRAECRSSCPWRGQEALPVTACGWYMHTHRTCLRLFCCCR